jgi:hypothetical protein
VRPCTELHGLTHQLVENYRATVALQFHHILTGERGRTGKIEQQALVDLLAIGVMEPGEVRHAWLG